MTPSWYLVALAFVLGAAAACVIRDVVSVTRRTGRHADTGTLDLSRAAARGELLHFDWGDARNVPNSAAWPESRVHYLNHTGPG